MVISVLVGILLVIQMGSAREEARRMSCLSNMKMLALSVSMYCQDYDERMPHAAKSQDQTYPYFKNGQILACPEGGTYAMNDKLSGRLLWEIPDPARTILLYEVDSEGERLYDVHHGGSNYAYVAGNVSWHEKSQ